jgi:uncharacterized protein YcfJ
VIAIAFAVRGRASFRRDRLQSTHLRTHEKREDTMESKTLLGAGVGAILAIGGMAVAQRYTGGETTPAPVAAASAPVEDNWADVRNVRPVMEQVKTPRKVCDQVAVTKPAPGNGNHVVGTAVGAAVGGLLGNQIGRGNGRKAATVAGAVGGGFIGHEVGVRHDANRTVTSTETRCRTVEDTSDKVVGYDVTYEFRGQSFTTRMDYDPGPRLRVEPTVAPVTATPAGYAPR